MVADDEVYLPVGPVSVQRCNRLENLLRNLGHQRGRALLTLMKMHEEMLRLNSPPFQLGMVIRHKLGGEKTVPDR